MSEILKFNKITKSIQEKGEEKSDVVEKELFTDEEL